MSSKPVIKQILFDVADTLLHKPALWETIKSTLANAGVNAEISAIARAHRAARELLTVPDRTGREFYLTFNARFLELLGVLPTGGLAEQIYLDCRGLPWSAFMDTSIIKELDLPIGIVSNWNSTLREQLHKYFPAQLFSPIVVSEEYGAAKPDPLIYREAVRQTGLHPNEILFIGDSIRLDIVPAMQTGLVALLVDRHGLYPAYNGYRVKSFTELPGMLQRIAEGA